MTTLSGKHGYVQVGSCSLAEFTQGELEYGSEPVEYFSRSGAGASQATDGPESGRGSFTINIDTENPASGQFESGDEVTLHFVHRETGAIEATGLARLGKRSFTIDRSGAMQQERWNFVTHKAWTFPGQA